MNKILYKHLNIEWNKELEICILLWPWEKILKSMQRTSL